MARAVKRLKTKNWYNIHAPKIFNDENIVGSTICSDSDKVINRTMDVKLSQLVGDVRKSDQKIKIKVVEVKGFDAYTKMVKYDLARMSLMRMVRRRSSKIESVDDEVSKEGQIVRAKSVLVTKGKATEVQRRLIINELSRMIKKKIKENSFDSFILAVISKQIQKEIIKPLRKLFPVIALEVRSIEVKIAKKTIGEHKDLGKEEAKKKEKDEKDKGKEEEPKEEVKEDKKVEVKKEEPKEEVKEDKKVEVKKEEVKEEEVKKEKKEKKKVEKTKTPKTPKDSEEKSEK